MWGNVPSIGASCLWWHWRSSGVSMSRCTGRRGRRPSSLRLVPMTPPTRGAGPCRWPSSNAATRVGVLAARRQARPRRGHVCSERAKPGLGPWMPSLRPTRTEGYAPRDARRDRVMQPFRFGVNVWQAASRAAWVDKARKLEVLGYAVLSVPDHLADFLAPLPALVSAAAATTHLRVGTYVLNNDFRHPVLVAREAA